MFAFEWTPREKWLAVIIGVMVFCFGLYIWTNAEEEPLGSGKTERYSAKQEAEEKSVVKERGNEEQSATEIVVDVKGAVKKPGIYTFSEQVRIYQVLQQAGGVLPEGDTNQINLAEVVSDGSILYIPKKGEDIPMIPDTGTGTSASKKININTATAEELKQLNGIGPSKAKAIVDYREEHGKFQSVDELTKVPGVGEKTLEQFRDQVEVR